MVCRSLLILAILSISLLAPAPGPAQACQLGCTPINIILSYLPDHSNWGPPRATGVVELVLAEGEARGRVQGLPRLIDEQYGLWLMSATTDDVLSFVPFNTDESQRGQFRLILAQEIPNRPWNMVLLTV